jgi:Zn-finger nucleic acid-binding protein
MICPKCSAAMESVVFEKIEVERCTACHGLFFEARKADKLKVLPGSEAIDIGTAEEGQKHNSHDRIRCPRDTTPMVRIVDRKQSHIHLETCPVCQGTFFDAGEFSDWKHETVLDVIKGWFARPRD